MRKILNIVVIMLAFPFTFLYGQEDIVKSKINEIARFVDTSIFVSRYESIESPCLCIDPLDSSVAYPKRAIINSDYRIQLTRKKKKQRLDSNGVKCLSEYIARYLSFQVKCINVEDKTISGKVEITYAYPASSLIQFLGFTLAAPDKNSAFFKKLIVSRGTFSLYPEADKYRIRLVISDPPYDDRNAYFGYLETVKDIFKPRADTAYVLNFDRMSIHKGDPNNQIEVRFTSTTHRNEMMYYAGLAYDVLRRKNSEDLTERAQALWLDNFLKNPQCKQCEPVYREALMMLSNKILLPNTSPSPAH